MIIEFLCDQNPVQYIFCYSYHLISYSSVPLERLLSYSSVPLEQLPSYSSVPLEHLVIIIFSLVFPPDFTGTVYVYYFPLVFHPDSTGTVIQHLLSISVPPIWNPFSSSFFHFVSKRSTGTVRVPNQSITRCLLVLDFRQIH